MKSCTCATRWSQHKFSRATQLQRYTVDARKAVAIFAAMDDTRGNNNDRLRALVATLELPPAVLMTIFNRGLGARACTASMWRGWLEPAHSPRFVPLCDELWQHAVQHLGPLTRSARERGEPQPEAARV